MVADAPHPGKSAADLRVRNVYHMLLYLWGRYDGREIAPDSRKVGLEGPVGSLPALFAHVLSEAVARQLRRGLHRDYQRVEEVGPRIRGRVQFAPSVGRMLFEQGLAQCAHDVFTADTLHNRILKTTLLRLLREAQLDPGLALRIRTLLPKMGEVAEIELRRRHFADARVHRNNRDYGLILDICRFIHEEAMPTPKDDPRMTFRSFAGDWFKRKGRIFQRFVAQFYKHRGIERGWELLGAPKVGHDFRSSDPASLSFLQVLESDVYVTHPESGRKLLIECKFYTDPFASKPKRRSERDDELSQQDFGSEPEESPAGDVRKFSNEHILQLGAYMDGLTRRLNKETKEVASHGVEGLLLYVQPGDVPLNADYVRQGVGGFDQSLRIRCLDLNKPWSEVEDDLLSYLA